MRTKEEIALAKRIYDQYTVAGADEVSIEGEIDPETEGITIVDDNGHQLDVSFTLEGELLIQLTGERVPPIHLDIDNIAALLTYIARREEVIQAASEQS